PGNSLKADHELRLKPDHPMGAGQAVAADRSGRPTHLLEDSRHKAKDTRQRAPVLPLRFAPRRCDEFDFRLAEYDQRRLLLRRRPTMFHGLKTIFAAAALTLVSAAAHAACTELAYSEPVLDCQNLGKSGSADFAASCAYVQAPPVEVEVECPGMWVNLLNERETHAAACSRVGLAPSSINGAVCASGNRQPTSGTGYDSINYRYGKAATSLSPGGK